MLLIVLKDSKKKNLFGACCSPAIHLLAVEVPLSDQNDSTCSQFLFFTGNCTNSCLHVYKCKRGAVSFLYVKLAICITEAAENQTFHMSHYLTVTGNSSAGGKKKLPTPLFLFLYNDRLYYWRIIKITQTNNGPDLVEASPGRQGLTIMHSPLCCNWQAGPANVAANKSHSDIPCRADSIIYNIYMCINTLRDTLKSNARCLKKTWRIKRPLRIILWFTEWFWSVVPSDRRFQTLPCVSRAMEAAAACREIKPSLSSITFTRFAIHVYPSRNTHRIPFSHPAQVENSSVNRARLSLVKSKHCVRNLGLSSHSETVM